MLILQTNPLTVLGYPEGEQVPDPASMLQGYEDELKQKQADQATLLQQLQTPGSGNLAQQLGAAIGAIIPALFNHGAGAEGAQKGYGVSQEQFKNETERRNRIGLANLENLQAQIRELGRGKESLLGDTYRFANQRTLQRENLAAEDQRQQRQIEASRALEGQREAFERGQVGAEERAKYDFLTNVLGVAPDAAKSYMTADAQRKLIEIEKTKQEIAMKPEIEAAKRAARQAEIDLNVRKAELAERAQNFTEISKNRQLTDEEKKTQAGIVAEVTKLDLQAKALEIDKQKANTAELVGNSEAQLNALRSISEATLLPEKQKQIQAETAGMQARTEETKTLTPLKAREIQSQIDYREVEATMKRKAAELEEQKFQAEKDYKEALTERDKDTAKREWKALDLKKQALDNDTERLQDALKNGDVNRARTIAETHAIEIKAPAEVANIQSQIQQRNALLPGELAKQGAEVGLTQAQTRETETLIPIKAESIEAETANRRAQTMKTLSLIDVEGRKMQAEVDKLLSESKGNELSPEAQAALKGEWGFVPKDVNEAKTLNSAMHDKSMAERQNQRIKMITGKVALDNEYKYGLPVPGFAMRKGAEALTPNQKQAFGMQVASLMRMRDLGDQLKQMITKYGNLQVVPSEHAAITKQLLGEIRQFKAASSVFAKGNPSTYEEKLIFQTLPAFNNFMTVGVTREGSARQIDLMMRNLFKGTIEAAGGRGVVYQGIPTPRGPRFPVWTDFVSGEGVTGKQVGERYQEAMGGK